jgi:hypothetical protein
MKFYRRFFFVAFRFLVFLAFFFFTMIMGGKK